MEMLTKHLFHQRVIPLTIPHVLHSGLGPQEIVHVCPQEFDDVREVYGLRRTIMERLLYHADQLALATHTYE